MENLGHISVKISGRTPEGKLNPKEFDISEIKEIISDFETLLFPTKADKENRPKITYEIKEGSVNNVFFLPLANAIMFAALMDVVGKEGNIDLLDRKQAAIIDKWQKKSYSSGRQYEIGSSVSKAPHVKITRDTQYISPQNEWVETSLYLYGKIYEEGGRKDVNLHILTDRYGALTVDATEEQLTTGDNKLFKIYGLWVKGKQNTKSGELKDLKLIEFIPYQPDYDKLSLQRLIKKSSKNWNKIKNKDKWLSDLRGGVNG
ncbi:MAG: hypothetical protein HOP10_16975 [Chitinophagaceae bacterium]|nr:hypothetical protein [Chitinophagaceae bacterium]